MWYKKKMERRAAHARLIRFARGEVNYCGKSSQYPRTTTHDYLLLDTHSKNLKTNGILSEETKFVKGIQRMQQF
jgi:ABC-type transport system involved in cytochrome c biogenesis ATPase subunit